MWHGVVCVFRDYGYRRLRNKARLKFLLAEWGPEKFREVLEEEYLGQPCPTGRRPRPPSGPRRPRRCPRAEGRQPLRRRRPDRGPGQRRAARRSRGHCGGAGSDARAADARTRSWSCSTCPPTGSTRSSHELEKLGLTAAPAARSAGTRWPAPASSTASSPSSRPRRPRPATVAVLEQRLADVIAAARHPDQPPRQRVPQLLRPHPGRRHRAQGPARHRRRRRPGARLPGAPRRWSRLGDREGPASAATSAASRSPPTSCPTTSSASCATSLSTSASPARRSPPGPAAADEGALQ